MNNMALKWIKIFNEGINSVTYEPQLLYKYARAWIFDYNLNLPT
jgi:hypothetical protein